MTPPRFILLVILSAALSAGVTSWLIISWRKETAPASPASPAPPSHRRGDFHEWLHARLELDPEQKEILAPAEERFEAERTRLLDRLETASGDLAHALSDPARGLEDLEPIMERRQRLQGEIQKLVMTHLIEKRARLTPAQLERYQKWIHESISHDHGE